MSASFTNKTRTNPLSSKRHSLWMTMADKVLGKGYDLSVVFVGDAFMRRINLTYRRKDKPTNVLAFPISKEAGEIYLDIPYVRRESKKYDHAPGVHLDYLFIHGLLHLAGYDHGDGMERHEARLMKKYIDK
jgi:probable rRNA maturation factor